MSRVFLDASALVPLVLRRDQWHPQLMRTMTALRNAGRPRLVTSNWTLYEAMAIVSRASLPLARQLHGEMGRPGIVHAVDNEIEREAVRRFTTWEGHGASVVDHANLLVARALRCEAILSFDSDFAPLVRTAGLRLIGSAHR